MASPSPEAEPPEQSDSSAEEAAAPADASSLWLVLARDVAIVAAALSLFAAADAWRGEELQHHRLLPGRSVSRLLMEAIASSGHLLMVERE